MIWNPILIILFCWTALIAPFKIAFLDTVPVGWRIIEETINVIILIDIGITFRTAFRDKNDKIIDDPYRITKRYLKSWFIPDVLAVFPYHLVI
jgi:hypothetical protein